MWLSQCGKASIQTHHDLSFSLDVLTLLVLTSDLSSEGLDPSLPYEVMELEPGKWVLLPTSSSGSENLSIVLSFSTVKIENRFPLTWY